MNRSELITTMQKYLSVSKSAAEHDLEAFPDIHHAEYATRQALINNLKTLCQAFLAQNAELELLTSQPTYSAALSQNTSETHNKVKLWPALFYERGPAMNSIPPLSEEDYIGSAMHTATVSTTWCPVDASAPVREAVALACAELQRARDSHAPMHSAHEGYAVLKEEVEELWAEIKRNPQERDPQALRAEAVQVAAMSLRFLVDIALPMQESQE